MSCPSFASLICSGGISVSISFNVLHAVPDSVDVPVETSKSSQSGLEISKSSLLILVMNAYYAISLSPFQLASTFNRYAMKHAAAAIRFAFGISASIIC